MQNKIRLFLSCILAVALLPLHLFCANKEDSFLKEQNEAILPRHLSPGRMYYNSLLEEAQKRSWSMQCVLHSSVATKGFDDNSQRKPLQDTVFGENVALKDIYLPSKLAFDNKIRIDLHDPRAITRSQNDMEGFGSFASDEYIYLLACVELNGSLEAREFGSSINTSYRFTLGERQGVQGVVGLLVPIKTRLHVFNLNVGGGTLFTTAFIPVGTGKETPLIQFNRDFSGVFDFFERGVLKPKGIAFKARQRSMGFGDMTLFGLFDFADYLERLSCLQIGTNIVLPTGRVGSQNILFPVSLGNGGVQFDFFVNTVFSSRARMFNPALHLVWNVALSYATTQRIPRRISNSTQQQIKNFPFSDTVPRTFRSYYVDPFSEFDTSVPAFAMTEFPIILSRAQRLLFGFGNYAYDVLSTGIQLAVFYDIMHKGGDCMKLDKSSCKQQSLNVSDSELDIAGTTKLTSERSHSLSWTLSYQFKNMVELNIGSQHVIAGKNVPRTHELFVSFIAVF